jgi:hypothetical protein
MSNPPPYNLTHLDNLLTTYLHLLDTYTQQRTTLSTHLSSGFFSLAQAQRSSMLPPGQRYGQEMYDQRMKAARRVRVRVREQEQEQEQEKVKVQDGDDAANKEEEAEAEEAKTELGRLPSFEILEDHANSDRPNTTSSLQSDATNTTPISTTHSPSSSAPTPPNTTKTPPPPPPTPPTPPPPRNPLHQFGLLTPPPLRTSQKAFTSAVNTIPDLLNTSRAMGELEEEIERVRASLGLDLSTEIETGDAAIVDNENETMDVQQAEKEPEARKERVDGKVASPTSPQRRSLTSRSKMSEPRSRVLKLGT